MAYRHTDRPIPPIAAVQPIRRVWPVGMFLTTPVSRVSLGKARAFYARKLQQRAKASGKTESDSSQE